MSFVRLAIGFLLCAMMFALAAEPASAAVTPEQRKEMGQLTRDLREATGLIRRKKLEEGEEILKQVETKLDALIEAGVPEADRMVQGIKRSLGLAQRSLATQRGEKPKDMGVSFSDEVAPIINAHCVDCHSGNNPGGGLKLDTFAGWKAGGSSRVPLAHVLIPRLTTPGPGRMPKDQQPLPVDQFQTIVRWMQEGFKFDGASDMAPIGEKDSAEKEEEEPVMIAKPTGKETVSFTKDVAPFIVNICVQCHSGNEPDGEYVMASFEGIMRGGASGQVIVPGEPEKSRLWLMVSNQEQPRMPPGQRRITRANYDALTTWIREGAVFDGDDAKKALREVVPSEMERQAEALASMTPAQFIEHRKKVSGEQWKRAFPQENVTPVETEQFLVYGNAPKERLDQVAGWANAHVETLRAAFGGATGNPLWKGKLAIFVTKDRFGYQEFALAVNERSQVPDNVHGHVIITPNSENAYIVMEDIPDAASERSPGMQAHLVNLLTQAYVEQLSTNLPDWVVQGSGLYLAAQAHPENPYFPALRRTANAAIGELNAPAQVFQEGALSPAQAPAMAAALVDYLIRMKGPATYARFIQQLSGGADIDQAISAVYGSNPTALGTAFIQNMANR